MRSVFIVDDDGLLREMLVRGLTSAGYDVKAFGMPSRLLSAFDAKRPDIIITDVQMPEMNGLELVEAIRERSSSFPVIVMTAHVTPLVERRARELDVSHVVSKPIRDAGVLPSLIEKTLSTSTEQGYPLDRLRMSFLTGLSHELRTPLTAIKFALDGLFSDNDTDVAAVSHKLVDIGQRNIDRIVRVVESQLDLLQVTLGDVVISRRLARLDDIVDNAVRQSRPARAVPPRVRHLADAEHRYLFTDPERLQSVIEYRLNRGPLDASAGIGMSINGTDSADGIAIDFTNIRAGDASGGQMADDTDAARQYARSTDGAFEFERRAIRCLMGALGCRVDARRSGTERLLLPVFPNYNRRVDLTLPLRHLRRAAVMSQRPVRVLRCTVRAHAGQNGLPHPEHDFLVRCLAKLRDGDIVVRGSASGVYYLALLERTDAQIQHILSFIGQAGAVDTETMGSSAKDVEEGELVPELEGVE